jgi:hypothetical protein
MSVQASHDPLPASFKGGNGRLEYADGRTAPCSYEIVQQGQGDVSIRCEHDHADWVFEESLVGRPGPVRFQATTDDGIVLSMEGDFLQLADLPDAPPPASGVQVRYVVNGPLRVERPQPISEPLSVRFALVNLVFTGNVFNRYELEGGGFRGALDTLQFQLGSRSASIVHAANYDDVVKTIRATSGVAITAFLVTTAADREDLNALRQDVTRLCALLTLATGCKVASAGDEARDASGQIVGGCRISPPARRFSVFVLIDTRERTHLAQVIEQTFDAYKALEADYEMGRLIDARVDAITGGFLETRTLMAGVLADYLTRRYALKHGYKARSFEERLRFMVSRVCPDMPKKDVRGFVRTRDHLAHEMRFSSPDPRPEHTAAMHVINRLILGLLGYNGPYVDCRTWEVVAPADAENAAAHGRPTVA